ncbi:MAG: hypothetical protein KBC95_03810 [Candidatus Peribacteraceae bacterium]|nr:hypothetical protein [Candidatus Peribacteraceae bacterium]
MPTTRRHRTVIAIVMIAIAVLVLLCLEISGLVSFSLGGNAIYNPMPGYGPLRTPSVSSSSAASHNAAFASSSSHSSASISSTLPVDEWVRARLERRLRLQQRAANRLY